MIRRSLSAVFALLVTTPLLAAPAGQQTLFNFVRPADVVQVATTDVACRNTMRSKRLKAKCCAVWSLTLAQRPACV